MQSAMVYYEDNMIYHESNLLYNDCVMIGHDHACNYTVKDKKTKYSL